MAVRSRGVLLHPCLQRCQCPFSPRCLTTAVHLGADLPQQPHYGTIRPFWTAIITIMAPLATWIFSPWPIIPYLSALWHSMSYFTTTTNTTIITSSKQNNKDETSFHFFSSIRFRDRFHKLSGNRFSTRQLYACNFHHCLKRLFLLTSHLLVDADHVLLDHHPLWSSSLSLYCVYLQLETMTLMEQRTGDVEPVKWNGTDRLQETLDLLAPLFPSLEVFAEVIVSLGRLDSLATGTL